MTSDFEIGRVVAVDTAEVSIQLNRDVKGMSRSTHEGPQEVGSINSYIIVPVGARRLVGMVTRVVLVEEAEMKADRTMVALPAARRLMKATLIGTVDDGVFRQGLSSFPVLDSPVQLATRADLNAILGPVESSGERPQDPRKPGFCVPVGRSAVVQDRSVRIDPDAFFGKHAAVLGSTGSGKSCTIASILQSIQEQPAVRRTTCVVLDTNGEYRAAFQRPDSEGCWHDVGPARCLYVPSDSGRPEDRLAIPYCFLDSEDYVRLFRAREGLQAPVLLRGLRLAKSPAAGEAGAQAYVEVLRTACEQILAVTLNTAPGQQWALAGNIRKLCDDGSRFETEFPEARRTLAQYCDRDVLPLFTRALEEVGRLANEAESRRDGGGDGGLGATRIGQIRSILEPVVDALVEGGDVEPGARVSADQPLFFPRGRFVDESLRTAMREQAESGNPGRIRDACAPMLLRIRRFLDDPRFCFLFDRYPDLDHVLAAFLRDVLGIGASPRAADVLSQHDSSSEAFLPFYRRQREGAAPVDVVVLDLSLLAAEVLDNVAALVGRLILEFLQRLGEREGGAARGSLPVVLVLEEAQNYIGRPRFGEDESISRVVFERIAREGRKYGLSLVVASQRPSELSKTVLSQCNSFIVHRLQNPEDLRYFREIVPGIYGPMLGQIPALAPQTALVLGECVAAPALVRIREARPLPRSRDPLFYDYWTRDEVPSVAVEAVCDEWEGRPETVTNTRAERCEDDDA